MAKLQCDVNNKEKSNVEKRPFVVTAEVDLVAIVLFMVTLATRLWRLGQPNSIVFDELHYGKYASLYIKQTFFFDCHPPLGKQLLALSAYLAGYDGNFKFDRIGSSYSSCMPVWALRIIPAVFGSFLTPTAYYIILQLGRKRWTAILAATLILLDNALLTQSRFALLDSIMLLFITVGIYFLLKFRQQKQLFVPTWFLYLFLIGISLACATCVKYVAFFSFLLAAFCVAYNYYGHLKDTTVSNRTLLLYLLSIFAAFVVVPVIIYVSTFYVHLSLLSKAGPHDNVMTSAFQASLEGGLASITKGQPLQVVHGSQITLRHTHGRTCWLHSHTHVYPIRYSDSRGSSHQQQVTCYSFKDVNNWWIIKRPNRNDLVVSEPLDAIRHGDIIQVVHGMSSRALNSHDVAAPMTPQNQEVSCYIDYNVSMPAQNLWRVEIVNKDIAGDVWHTIQSQVRLIHVNSSQALKFTGRQLPDWGFHQHEVVTDRIINQEDTIWNVEEHRYTQSADQKDRERELGLAEFVPTAPTKLSFWDKFWELQIKMFTVNQENVQDHLYSSEPHEWPTLSRGIAYWISSDSNAQIHLLGNIAIWYTATFGLVVYVSIYIFYLLRRRRLCFDLSEGDWSRFSADGLLFLSGYLLHYVPYFFIERTLFLHHYLPSYIFKLHLLAIVVEHLYSLIQSKWGWKGTRLFQAIVTVWISFVFHVYLKFLAVSYGNVQLVVEDVVGLRWKDSWDFIVHRT
ncbi:hypothetical protein CHUAL_009843 [Chamberlinius hualienensis]